MLTVDKILKQRKGGKCKCSLCRRSRRFYRNTAKLKKPEMEWMREFYDYVLNVECEDEMRKAVEGIESC